MKVRITRRTLVQHPRPGVRARLKFFFRPFTDARRARRGLLVRRVRDAAHGERGEREEACEKSDDWT